MHFQYTLSDLMQNDELKLELKQAGTYVLNLWCHRKDQLFTIPYVC